MVNESWEGWNFSCDFDQVNFFCGSPDCGQALVEPWRAYWLLGLGLGWHVGWHPGFTAITHRLSW